MILFRIYIKEVGIRLILIIIIEVILEYEVFFFGWMIGIYVKEFRNFIKEGRGKKIKIS